MASTTTYAHVSRKASGKAVIDGTRVAVADVAALVEEGLSPADIRKEFAHLTLAQVHSALAYFYDHRDEIEADWRKADVTSEGLKRDLSNRSR